MHNRHTVHPDGGRAIVRLAPPGRHAGRALVSTRCALVAVLSCALLAACGGDDAGSPAASQLTQANTLAQAPSAAPADAPAPAASAPIWRCATAC